MEPSAERAIETQRISSQFAGVWRRIGALLVDAAVLGVLGFPLGLLLGERYAPAGTPARLIGLILIVPYLGLMGSRLGGGQTLGKRLLGLRIVDVHGQPIPVARAFVRAALLSLPWIFNGIRFGSSGPVVMAALWVAGILVFGIGGAILGTFLLNRPTRQALHDLVVGTYVVQADGRGLPVPGKSTRRPLVASSVWVGAVAVATTVMVATGPRLMADEFPPSLMESLSAIPGATSYELKNLTTWGAGRSSKSIVAVIWFRGAPDDTRKAAQEVAAVILQQHPGALDAQTLIVSIVRGWDVGVVRSTRAQNFVQTPAQWRADLGL